MTKVTYVDHMGTDITVVNAARVSFAKRVDPKRLPTATDARLLRYLARGCSSTDWAALVSDLVEAGERGDHGEVERLLVAARSMPRHWTPFAHPVVTFHLTAPLFVARQAWRSHVGAAGGDVGYPAWNEVSRRYVDDPPEFFRPDVWRARAPDAKQGSLLDPAPYQQSINAHMRSTYKIMRDTYNLLVDGGVAPEQARMTLPQSTYVEWWWTGSLAFWARVCTLRLDSHTQAETCGLADQIADVMKTLYPLSWSALMEG